MGFYPYPTEMPTSAVIALVMEAINNRVIDPKETAHAVWHLAGYGLSKWDVHTAFGSPYTLSSEDALAVLESMKAAQDDPDKFGAPVIPWNVFLPFLLALLQKLLS